MQSRFGPNWQDHMELIDNTINEDNRLFADICFATTWLIYHYALPQEWWEKGTQDYIHERGFKHWQW